MSLLRLTAARSPSLSSQLRPLARQWCRTELPNPWCHRLPRTTAPPPPRRPFPQLRPPICAHDGSRPSRSSVCNRPVLVVGKTATAAKLQNLDYGKRLLPSRPTKNKSDGHKGGGRAWCYRSGDAKHFLFFSLLQKKKDEAAMLPNEYPITRHSTQPTEYGIRVLPSCLFERTDTSLSQLERTDMALLNSPGASLACIGLSPVV